MAHTYANNDAIHKTVESVKETLRDAEGGHDWFHIERVWNTAKHIGVEEGEVDMLVVELGALLHDIADSKFHNGDEEIGPKTAESFLRTLQLEEKTIEHVKKIVQHVSYKGSLDGQKWMSDELAIVQDADRLDALGAIGIGRTFNYGGFRGTPMYDPEIKPKLNMSKEEYKASEGTTINHFYEKLLLLKDRMNTKTGQEIAKHRHVYMEKFLDEFYKEWKGEL